MAFLAGILRPVTGLTDTLQRFPLAVIACVIGFVLAVLVHEGNFDFGDRTFLPEALLLSILSFFWCGAAALMAEARSWPSARLFVVSLLGVAGLAGIAFLNEPLPVYTALVPGPALVLLIMAAPFIGAMYDDERFWGFNRQYMYGVAVAFISALILYLGLAAALLALDKLFGVDIDDSYFYLWLFTAVLCAPLYALYWIPRPDDTLTTIFDTACRVLVNMVLVPLALIYFVILYAYGLKILLLWALPDGGLAILAAGFCGLGVATYMASWPVRDSGALPVRLFHRYFFYALVIPVVLMGLAIAVRIGDYGVTEQRYFVALVWLWLVGIVAATIIRGGISLRVLPLSLAALLFFSSFGPWGAPHVSAWSQQTRLHDIFARYDMLAADGTAQATTQTIPFEDQREITSIVNYLATRDRVRYLPSNMADAAVEEKTRYPDARAALLAVGLDYVHHERQVISPGIYSLDLRTARKDYRDVLAEDISGYDVRLATPGGEIAMNTDNRKTLSLETNGMPVTLSYDGAVLSVAAGDYEVLDIHVATYITLLLETHIVGPQVIERDSFVLNAENPDIRARLQIHSGNGQIENGAATAQNLNFNLFLDLPE